MKRTKKFELISISFLFLLMVVFLIPNVRSEETVLMLEDAQSNYYLHSTMTIWQRIDADPTRDYYLVKLTVTEHYAQNDVFNEMLVMDAGLEVHTTDAEINRAERKPPAGYYNGGSITITFGPLSFLLKLPGSLLFGSSVILRTDTTTEQQWHVYGAYPVTSNYLDFVIKVSVPEDKGLRVSGWSWAKWHKFWPIPPGWFLPDKSGYGPTHYNFVPVPEGGGGGGCPILSVYDGEGYYDDGLLDIHDPNGIDQVTTHSLRIIPEPINNRYLLRLTEHPKTISHLDKVEFYGRLPDGQLVLLSLKSATHSSLGNVKQTLKSSDDIRVDILGADHNDGLSQHIDLEFEALKDQNFVGFEFVIEGHNLIIK